ncbi:16S rRNA (uracil(1498)-N(3))-methyltransferase [Microbacterium sediminis]|uniref:Ribosomal RNA small subunit methyltransferase E n=1 Tax=Microbacterium sediminis TaxID=904291 RepID=A0A1B9NGS2_9MICO|nr:16S rRNA (uracil(1498)-N(3))-methyltransferase [Microbacterium sediminis]OCG75811.1 16S rRNA (uracil(1498)-N(3))-methyltransferase [Microbacterium sediminis]QBR74202.1 16S rRNA (uracil(1498)-N(3))-methyltransferase [Microbacterium sediminis]
MALHFVDDAAADAQPGDELELTGAEAHHAAAVRRVRPGEAVTVGDGRGVWLEGEVIAAEPKRVRVRVDARRVEERAAPRLALVQALAKGDRDELAVQAATELGVDEVVPWQAARSVSRWEGPKARKGRDRWVAIVREAAKQAHRAWVPEVAEIATTGQLAQRDGLILVLDPWTDTALSRVDIAGVEELTLVVGPEGGIAPDELERLEAAGARRVRLGDTVLRTSTAGPAALAVLNARLGRW